ncbi:hypothetical protein LOTGIDRAFT_156217 [Lottia gigantea]|uniref:Uncharacterized protein n=1 Tax=Lottia gigantea TaxID=225164 RepID=V4B3M4_LOTGI|nr:hypothetical protein LOTGIDRAFT_156217 [Lottia gigantea]ESP04968.1 hypothetical protein LOTGIDRAFT_156217 [Lottia gigantea]
MSHRPVKIMEKITLSGLLSVVAVILAVMAPMVDAWFDTWNPFATQPAFEPEYFDCKFYADRSGGNCQSYFKECEDFWSHKTKVTHMTCPGELFFSESFEECVDPKKFFKRCPVKGHGFFNSRW